MVFNLGRSFFGSIMWSQQDPFQIRVRRYRSQISLSSWASAEVDSRRERDPKRSCRASRVNDAVVTDERMVLTTRDLTPEGVIKLSLGRKRHVLLRAV